MGFVISKGIVMSKGNWSFIHKWTIYEYLINRSEEKTLRLKRVYYNSNIVRKDMCVTFSL